MKFVRLSALPFAFLPHPPEMDYVNEKLQWHHRESNPRSSDMCLNQLRAHQKLLSLFNTLIIYIVPVYGWGLNVQYHKNFTTSRNHKV